MKISDLRKGHYVMAIRVLSVILAIAGLMAGMAGCSSGSPAIEIRTWYELNATRANVTRNYILMNDLDSTTAGYEELASPTANNGMGWDPIGRPMIGVQFAGTFDGNGHKICDLFINRALDIDVGLFGTLAQGFTTTGAIKNLGVVNCTVIGDRRVGGLVGLTGLACSVSNCYVTGTVTGNSHVGGLIGSATGFAGGVVSNCYFIGSVTGTDDVVGGLLGWSNRTVSGCWATGSVTGNGGGPAV